MIEEVTANFHPKDAKCTPPLVRVNAGLLRTQSRIRRSWHRLTPKSDGIRPTELARATNCSVFCNRDQFANCFQEYRTNSLPSLKLWRKYTKIPNKQKLRHFKVLIRDMLSQHFVLKWRSLSEMWSAIKWAFFKMTKISTPVRTETPVWNTRTNRNAREHPYEQPLCKSFYHFLSGDQK